MAISDYLSKLNTLRNELADNLVTMGVAANHKETLSALVPKVLDISQGGDGGVNNLFLSDSEHTMLVMPHDVNTVWLRSDTVLNPSLSISDFDAAGITEITYVNALVAKATVDTEKVAKGTRFQVQAKTSAYLNKNGASRTLNLPVKNMTDDLDGITLGRTILTSSYSDGGTYSIPLSKFKAKPFLVQCPDLTEEGETSLTIALTGDSLLTCGDMNLYVNNRDNGYLNLYLLELPMDDVKSMIRVTWDGYMPYNQGQKYRSSWDFAFFGNGDALLHILKYGESANRAGTYKLNNSTFSDPGEGGHLSIYRDDFYGTRYRLVNEMYDIGNHNSDCDSPVLERTLETMLEDTNGMTVGFSTGADDQTITFTNTIMSWPYKGSGRTTFYISTNSWIGITGSSSEDIRVNRRDAYGTVFYHAVYHLTDLDLKCYRIRWEGSSYYSNHSVEQIFEVYFYENGDAMLRLIKKGSQWNGTFSFFGVSYSIEEGECISFYRTDVESSGWMVVNGKYDITKHIA